MSSIFENKGSKFLKGPDVARGRYDNSERNLAARESNIEDSQKQLKVLIDRKELFEAERNEYIDIIGKEEVELPILNDSIIALESVNPQAEQLKDMRNSYSERSEELNRVRARLDNYTRKNGKDFMPEIEKLNDKIAKQVESLKEFKYTHENVRLDWKNLELDDTQEKVTSNQQKIEQLNDAKKVLEAEEKQIRATINNFSGDDLIAKNQRLNEIVAELNSNKTDVKDLRKEIKSFEKAIVDIKQDIADTELRLGSMISEAKVETEQTVKAQAEQTVEVETEQTVEAETELSNYDIWVKEQLEFISQDKISYQKQIEADTVKLSTLDQELTAISKEFKATFTTFQEALKEATVAQGAFSAATNTKNAYENSSAFQERNTDLTPEEQAHLDLLTEEQSKAREALGSKITIAEEIKQHLEEQKIAKTDLISERNSVNSDINSMKEYSTRLEASEIGINNGQLLPTNSDEVNSAIVTDIVASIELQKNIEAEILAAKGNPELEKELSERLIAMSTEMKEELSEDVDRGISVSEFEDVAQSNDKIIESQVATANSIKESKTFIGKVKTFARDKFSDLKAGFTNLKEKLSRDKEPAVEVKGNTIITEQAYNRAKGRESLMKIVIYTTAEEAKDYLAKHQTVVDKEDLSGVQEIIVEMNELQSYSSPVDELKKAKEGVAERTNEPVIENKETVQKEKTAPLAM